MTRLEITLKSGAKVLADVETFEITKFVSGSWKFEWTPIEPIRLVHIEVAEIAAIVEVVGVSGGTHSETETPAEADLSTKSGTSA